MADGPWATMAADALKRAQTTSAPKSAGLGPMQGEEFADQPGGEFGKPGPWAEAARAALKRAPGGAYDATVGMSTPEVFAASAGRLLSNLGVGVQQRMLEYAMLHAANPEEQKFWADLHKKSQSGVLDERQISEALMKRQGSGWGEAAAGTGAMAMLPARAGTGAPVGAFFGALEPTAPGESVTKNIVKGGIYGLAGEAVARGIVAPAFEAIAGTLGKAYRWVTGKSPPVSIAPPLPPEMAQRKSAIEATGATPSQAEITRDPNDWYRQIELAKSEGAPKTIAAEAQKAKDLALKQTTAGMRTSGSAPLPDDAYAQSQSVQRAVHGYDKDAKAVAGGTYTAAETAPGANVPVDADLFWSKVNPVLEVHADSLPGVVKTRLQELQAGTLANAGEMPAASGVAPRALTVGEMSNLFQLTNKIKSGGDVGYALGQLKSAIADVGESLPQDAAPAFKLFSDATQQWRTQARALEPKPIAAFADATEGSLTPELLDRQVRTSGPGDLASLKSMAAGGSQEAANAVHDSVIDYLYHSATSDANGTFSGARLGKAMDTIGVSRLAAILEPQEMQKLMRLRMAAEAMTVPPVMTGANVSSSGSTAANLAKRGMGKIVEGIPFVGPLMNAGIESMAQRRAGNEMRSLLEPDLESLAYRLSGELPPDKFGRTLGMRVGQGAGAGGVPTLADLYGNQ